MVGTIGMEIGDMVMVDINIYQVDGGQLLSN